MAQVLMSDPWRTDAMRMMARALADKGRVRAACKVLERAREIDPGDARTAGLLETVRKRLYATAPVGSTRVRPPDFDWLEYLLDNRVNDRLRPRIIALAERLPHDPVVQYQAARLLLDAGKNDLARPLVARAASRMPHHPTVVELRRRLDALTRADSGTGRGDPTLLNHWGYTLLQQNKLDDAAVQFHAVLRIDPKNADAHNNLGLVYRLQGKHDLALEHYRKVIELLPHEPEGYRTLAAALRGLGRHADCVQVLERGLHAVPDDAELKLRLAWMLSTAPEPHLRNGTRAVTLAETGCGEIDTCEDLQHLGILAAAYAEAGQFDKAVEKARKAVEVAHRRQEAPLEKVFAERLALYTKRQPYRQPKPGGSP
ncbi:MAG TPA: tetratricopeptide repeat protein, partial [Planctomycetota bacterium]|nr:tetratricopeptide repeat protein [Planctomycetota bacterium]